MHPIGTFMVSGTSALGATQASTTLTVPANRVLQICPPPMPTVNGNPVDTQIIVSDLRGKAISRYFGKIATLLLQNPNWGLALSYAKNRNSGDKTGCVSETTKYMKVVCTLPGDWIGIA